MKKVIRIDEEKCTGCGTCVNTCHEGALQLVNGKAKLVSESYCDGLGACLPNCPSGALSLVDRETGTTSAADNSVRPANAHLNEKPFINNLGCGCPGSHAKTIERKTSSFNARTHDTGMHDFENESQLRQWPCQIRLVPVNAPYFDNAHLLIAADCTAYAYANMHRDFMRNKITIIGCPKLDATDYSEKLGEILKNHDIKSITVLRMEVPCCGGLVQAVKQALINSNKMIPWSITIISTDGNIVET
ncbi:MAG TPA: 4Fe-4S binding protein [Clostridiaceae bacterium]|nr:4Fe-4S binding protein [Clostridiaceae bacterium]